MSIIDNTKNLLSWGYSAWNAVRQFRVGRVVTNIAAAAAIGNVAQSLIPDGYSCTERTFNPATHFVDETENCGPLAVITGLWMAYGLSVMVASCCRRKKAVESPPAAEEKPSSSLPQAVFNISKGVVEDLANGLNLYSLLPMAIDSFSYRMGFIARSNPDVQSAILGMLFHQLGTQPLTFDSWMFLGGFLNRKGLISDYAVMDLLALGYASLKSLETICHAYSAYRSICGSELDEHAIRKMISSSILGAYGTALLCHNCEAALTLHSGMRAAARLDGRQAKAAREFRVIRELASEKQPCKAVVFFGFMNDFRVGGSKFDRIPHPDVQAIYEGCQTHLYRAGSSMGLCHGLLDATKAFGERPDAVVLKGHHSVGLDGLRLFKKGNMDYVFNERNDLAVKCIRAYLKPKGRVVLSGCNTAYTMYGDSIPLADRLSRLLPNIEILGTQGSNAAGRSWIEVLGGKFSIEGQCHQTKRWELGYSVVDCGRSVLFTEEVPALSQ